MGDNEYSSAPSNAVNGDDKRRLGGVHHPAEIRDLHGIRGEEQLRIRLLQRLADAGQHGDLLFGITFFVCL